MNKSVYSRSLDNLKFFSTMATHSKMDWDYYVFYLTIIDTFCEKLSHFYCDKGKVPSQVMVTLIVLY